MSREDDPGARPPSWMAGFKPDTDWSDATLSIDFAAASRTVAEPSRPPAQPRAPGAPVELPAVGTMLGHSRRFELLQPLGVGGMSQVYRAFDRELSRYVAIKFMLPTLSPGVEAELAMLRNEARAIARLNHQNVVHVFDIGLYEGRPFIVMELLDGEPLRDMIARGPMSAGECIIVCDQILAGLEHAHAQGVVHRDLKPGNIFRTAEGRVVILDFGIALFEQVARKRAPGDDSGKKAPAGTPYYMSPEQWLEQPQDPATDVWSLGVILYEMLTGERPFAHVSLSRLLRQVTTPGPPNFLRRSDLIPPALYRVLRGALDKDPARRYRDAAGFRRALWSAAEDLQIGIEPRALRRSMHGLEQRIVSVLAASVGCDATVPFARAADVMRAWQNTIAGEVHRAGGTLVSSIADHALAIFGYPSVREDDAVRAIRAGRAVLRFADTVGAQLGVPLDVRVGVATWLGVVEERGGGDQSPVLRHDGAEAAVMLRDAAAVGELWIDPETREMARGYFAMQPVEGQMPAGRDDDERPFRVLFPIDVVARFDAAQDEALAPLLGRDDEVAVLEAAWRRARDGVGASTLVIGDAGLGKSRLIHQLKQSVLADGGTIMTCQCWPQSQGSSFHPVISLLRRSMGIDIGRPADEQRAQLTTALAAIGLDRDQSARVLGTLLSLAGGDDATGATGAPPPARQRAEIIDHIVRFVHQLAARGPVALIIEDLHWVDYSTLELVERLLAETGGHRLLLLLSARPEFEPPWLDADLAVRRLEPLSPRVASHVIAEVAGRMGVDTPLPRAMINDIVERCGGIPLYLEEMTRLLIASGVDDGTTATLPGTLHEMLGARLGRLGASARAIAQIGAVLGREFRRDYLDRLGELSPPSIDEALAELDHERVLSLAGDRYFFRHALLRDAAYQSLPDEHRRALHRAVAALLAADAETGHEVPPELLAWHYDEAGQRDRALDHWEEAGRRAARRWASREAIDHLTRAAGLLRAEADPQTRERELAILLVLGPALMTVKGYANPEVQTVYRRAYELSDEKSARQVFPALVGLWQYDMVGGRLARSEEIAARLFDLAEKADDRTLGLIGRRAIGTSKFLRGELLPAITHFEAGWAAYDIALHGEMAHKHGNDPGIGHAVYLAWSQWIAGRPDRARAAGRDAVALADRLKHPMSAAFSRSYAAIAHNLSGDYEAAKGLAEAAIAIAEEHALELWYAFACVQLGAAEVGLGRFDEGIGLVESGVAAWQRTGAGAGTTSFGCLLADALLRAGRRDAAGDVLEGVRATIERNDEHYYEPEWRRLVGAYMASSPVADPAAVERNFTDACTLARAQGAASWALRAGIALADARTRDHGALPPDDPALTALRDARAMIEGGADTLDVRTADRLLNPG